MGGGKGLTEQRNAYSSTETGDSGCTFLYPKTTAQIVLEILKSEHRDCFNTAVLKMGRIEY